MTVYTYNLKDMLADFCLSTSSDSTGSMSPFEILESQSTGAVQPLKVRPHEVNNQPIHAHAYTPASTEEVKIDTGLANEEQFIDPEILKAYKASKRKKKKPTIPGTALLKQLKVFDLRTRNTRAV